MTLWASDLQSDSDLDSIRNSCDVFLTKVYLFVPFFTSFLLCGAPTLQCQFFWSMCDANFHLPQYANCSTCCMLCPTWDHCDQNLAAKIIHSHFCLWINSNVFVHLLSFGLTKLQAIFMPCFVLPPPPLPPSFNLDSSSYFIRRRLDVFWILLIVFWSYCFSVFLS